MQLVSSCINSSWCTPVFCQWHVILGSQVTIFAQKCCYNSQLEHEKRGRLCDSYHGRRISHLAIHFFKYFRRSLQSWFLKNIYLLLNLLGMKKYSFFWLDLYFREHSQKRISNFTNLCTISKWHTYAMKHTHAHCKINWYFWETTTQ